MVTVRAFIMYTTSNSSNSQITRSVTRSHMRCQPGDCRWSSQSSSGVCVNTYGLICLSLTAWTLTLDWADTWLRQCGFWHLTDSMSANIWQRLQVLTLDRDSVGSHTWQTVWVPKFDRLCVLTLDSTGAGTWHTVWHWVLAETVGADTRHW